jgi:hypothetical protein
MTIKRTISGPGVPGGFPFSLATEANGVCFVSARHLTRRPRDSG